MKIIHVTGCMCAGKSYVMAPFLAEFKIPCYSVKEFYKKHKCFDSDGRINWNNWRDNIQKLPKELAAFLSKNKNFSVVFLESTGMNISLAKFLKQSNYKVSEVEIETPENNVLRERAIKSGANPDQVIELAKNYVGRRGFYGVSQEKAEKTVRRIINEETKRSAIN